MPKKVTTEEWVARAKNIHGDKYDYSQAEYTAAKNQLTIVCRNHGPFSQRPYSHIAGNGCPKCKGETLSSLRGKSTDDFIRSAIRTHGERYDYSKALYTGSHDTVQIKCRLHGIFLQKATNHLSGSGCPKCGREIVESSRRVSFTEFVDRARRIHGDFYHYSRGDYESIHKKCLIQCPKHGDFRQAAASHLSGNGCPECGRERIASHKLSNTSDFIEKATMIHGDEYDYSRTQYLSATEKVEVVCRKHGSFLQTPNSHLGGKGCSGCGKYGFRQDKSAWFYYARINLDRARPLWMVGITNRSFEERYSASDKEKMKLVHVEHFESGADALELETSILRRHKSKVFKGTSPLKSKGKGSGKSNEIFVEDVLGLDQLD